MKGTNTYVHHVLDGDTPLAHGASVRFRLSLPYGMETTLEVAVTGDAQDELEIRAIDGRLVVLPNVSNSINVRADR